MCVWESEKGWGGKRKGRKRKRKREICSFFNVHKNLSIITGRWVASKEKWKAVPDRKRVCRQVGINIPGKCNHKYKNHKQFAQRRPSRAQGGEHRLGRKVRGRKGGGERREKAVMTEDAVGQCGAFEAMWSSWDAFLQTMGWHWNNVIRLLFQKGHLIGRRWVSPGDKETG